MGDEKIVRIPGESLTVKISAEEQKYREKYLPDPKKLTDEKLVCTVCSLPLAQYIHKGKDIFVHRILHVLVCETCYNFYGDGAFSVDEDGDDKYCRWCGQGGTLYLCSTCSCAFCQKCVKQNLKPSVLADLEKDDWKCYICNPRPLFGCRTICWGAEELNKIGKEKEKERLQKLKERQEKLEEKKKEGADKRSRKASSSEDETVLKKKKRDSSDSSSPEVMPKKRTRKSQNVNGNISRSRRKKRDSSSDSDSSEDERKATKRSSIKKNRRKERSSSESSDGKKKSKVKNKKKVSKDSSDESSDEDKRKPKRKSMRKREDSSDDESSNEKSRKKKKVLKKKKGNASDSSSYEKKKRSNKKVKKGSSEESSDDEKVKSKKSLKKKKADSSEEDSDDITKKHSHKKGKQTSDEAEGVDGKLSDTKVKSKDDAIIRKRIKLAILWLSNAMKDIAELGTLISVRATKFSTKKVNTDSLKSYDDVLKTVSKLKQLISGIHSNYDHIDKSIDAHLKPWKILTGIEEQDKQIENVETAVKSEVEDSATSITDAGTGAVESNVGLAMEVEEEDGEKEDDSKKETKKVDEEMDLQWSGLSADDDSDVEQKSTREAISKANETLDNLADGDDNDLNKSVDSEKTTTLKEGETKGSEIDDEKKNCEENGLNESVHSTQESIDSENADKKEDDNKSEGKKADTKKPTKKTTTKKDEEGTPSKTTEEITNKSDAEEESVHS